MEADFKRSEKAYLTERRGKVFSGEVPGVPSKSMHYCKEIAGAERECKPMQTSRDGAYTEYWCALCFKYLRMMVPT